MGSVKLSVKVRIHPFLVHLTDQHELIEMDCSTVGECLHELSSRYPDIKEWLFEKDGKINNLLEVYVNGESSYPEELAKPVRDGDELQTVIFITGG